MQIRADNCALHNPIYRFARAIADTFSNPGKRLRRGSEQGGAEVILEADQRRHIWDRGCFSEYIAHRPHLKATCNQIK